MSKIKILLTLLLSITIIVLIIACPTTATNSNSSDDSNTQSTTTTDTTAPFGISSTASGTTIKIVYNEEIDFASAADTTGTGFTVKTGATAATATTTNIVTKATIDGTIVNLEVTNLLTPGHVALVTVVKDAIIDIAGNSLANAATPSISPDITAPTVSSVVAEPGTEIKVIFNETISFGTGGQADGTGFTATSGTTNLPIASVAVNITTLTVTLASALKINNKVKITFDTTVLQDTASNAILASSTKDTIVAIAVDTSNPTIDTLDVTGATKEFKIIFSENVTFPKGKTTSSSAPDGITLTVEDTTSTEPAAVNPIKSAEFSNKELILTLTKNLPETGIAKITFRGDAILDIAENRLVAIVKDVNF